MEVETIDRHFNIHNFTDWIVETTPFAPRFEPKKDDSESEDKFTITFNQGYIFDYANGGEKMPIVPDGSFEVALGGTKTFFIEIEINDHNGLISAARIKDKDDDQSNEDDGFTNLENASLVEEAAGGGLRTAGDIKKIKMDLMEIKGPHLVQFYIRENIHLWFRGFTQSGSTNGHAPLLVSPSAGANDVIEFRDIMEDPEEDNRIQITTVGNSIQFYVPPESSEPPPSQGGGN